MEHPTPSAPGEGVDGTAVRYQERLVPPWWAWAAVLFITGSLGIAYGFVLGRPAGVITFAIATAAAVWGLVASTPVVRVDDAVVRAGRARLPLPYVGHVDELDADAVVRLRGTGADARAFLCLRAFVRTGVRLEVDDARDPHPYWLVSTRHPDRLAAAIRAATQGARTAG